MSMHSSGYISLMDDDTERQVSSSRSSDAASVGQDKYGECIHATELASIESLQSLAVSQLGE